ncbi:hypothetical protein JYG46_23505, partial [Escherichia fergusonii]|uniref:hypothetical protein n=1 Tax=Escherichia fergusonii TaxID=564 RepID=UPI001CBA8557
LAGVTADALGLPAAMWLVAGITFVSGVVVALRMTETRKRAEVGPGRREDESRQSQEAPVSDNR